MTTGIAQNEVERLAVELLADIRSRGLKPGDRYLTAEQARRMLQARKSTVNSAMRRLANRDILVRKQRAGTFIGPRFGDDLPEPEDSIHAVSVFSRVHILKALDPVYKKSTLFEKIVPTLNEMAPGVIVQVHHIPAKQFPSYARGLVDEIKARNNGREGLVLILSSRQAQIDVQASGLPAIIFGSAYPGVGHIPSIDADHLDAGRQAAEYSIAKGCKHFALLMPNEWRRGDSLALNGLTQALGMHGLGMDALEIHNVYGEEDAIAAEVRQLLQHATPPDMIFCRHDYIAEIVHDQLRTLPAGASRPEIVALFSNDPYPKPYARLVSAVAHEQQIRIGCNQLVAMGRQEPIESMCTSILTRMLEPGQPC